MDEMDRAIKEMPAERGLRMLDLAQGQASGADAARDRLDAAAMRAAREAGLEVHPILIADVHFDVDRRDRILCDLDALEELMGSIQTNGLRMPIEVTPRRTGGYDLVSGYRRLAACRALHGERGRVLAFLRPASAAPDAFRAMVEENEVRAGLSAYERGRVAVLAVEAGAFADVAEAVNALHPAATKGKRSKLRSFALVHEALGDRLAFPQALTERQCLRLAAAIKGGARDRLREALEGGGGGTAAAEWAALAAALGGGHAPEAPAGGRVLALGGGRTIRRARDGRGRTILVLEGPVDDAFAERLLDRIAAA